MSLLSGQLTHFVTFVNPLAAYVFRSTDFSAIALSWKELKVIGLPSISVRLT